MDSSPLNAKYAAKLAAEFRSQRERNGFTLHEVFEETRIPLDVLEAFEQNALRDHPTFNRVYLRSVVRSYASAIGFPESEALQALESAERQAAKSEEDTTEPDTTEAGTTEQSVSGTPSRGGSAADRSIVDESPDDESSAGSSEAPASSSDRPAGPSVVSSAAASSGASSGASTSVSTTAPAPTEAAGMDAVVVTRSALRIVGIVAASLIVVAAAVAYFTLTPSSVDDALPSPVVAETLPVDPSIHQTRESAELAQGDTSVSDERETQARLNGESSTSSASVQPVALSESYDGDGNLSDSVAVIIQSLGQPVRGIRIRLDRGLRRPYWIERDSTLTLYFRERAIIEEHNGLVRVDAPAVGFSSDRLDPGRAVNLRRR